MKHLLLCRDDKHAAHCCVSLWLQCDCNPRKWGPMWILRPSRSTWQWPAAMLLVATQMFVSWCPKMTSMVTTPRGPAVQADLELHSRKCWEFLAQFKFLRCFGDFSELQVALDVDENCVRCERKNPCCAKACHRNFTPCVLVPEGFQQSNGIQKLIQIAPLVSDEPRTTKVRQLTFGNGSITGNPLKSALHSTECWEMYSPNAVESFTDFRVPATAAGGIL